MHPLDDPILTLAYAREHLDKLEAALSAHQSVNPNRATRQFDAQNCGYVLRFELPALPSWRVRLMIGDVVFYLRAALDHLAWRLARLTTETPAHAVQFPIRKDGNVGRVYLHLQGIPPAAQQIIEELQPYHRTDGPEYHLLWLLHDLCTIAKHRHINVVGMMAHVRVTLPPLTTSTIEVLNQREIVLTVPATAEADEGLEPQVSCDVTFGMQEPRHGRSLLVLRDIHDFIRDAVFPRFTGFFPERIK